MKRTLAAGVALLAVTALAATTALYACDDGDGDTNGAGDGGTKDSGKTKDGGEAGIMGDPNPQDGAAIPDADIDALKHLGDSGMTADGSGSDADKGDGHSGGDSETPDGGHGGDSDMGDAGMKGCTYTISGGGGGGGTCLALAAAGGSGLSFTLTNTGSSATSLTFGTTISSTGPLMMGTYTTMNTSFSAGTYQVIADDMSSPPTGSWAECYRPGNPCTGYAPTGPAPTFNDVGDFTLTINDPGASELNALWANACGTFTADYPAQEGTNSPGTVSISAKFCGMATPDASAPDAAMDAGATGACMMTMTGAVSGSVGCKVSSATYISSENISTVSISGTPPDGGMLHGDMEQLDIVLPGQLLTETYTTTSVTATCQTSPCNVTGAVSNSAGQWEETWSPTGSSNGGTWQVQINQLGGEDPIFTGFNYVGLHGVYTGTLPIDTGSATGMVNLTVSF